MTTKAKLIRDLCEERGCWGDGTPATPDNIEDAAQHPGSYDIDIEDLDDACAGDVASLLRLRRAWGLPAFV